MIFEGRVDRYKGIEVTIGEANAGQFSCQRFQECLKESLKDWIEKKYRVSWFKIPLKYSQFIPVLEGFVYHHAKTEYSMMYKWISDNEPSNIPSYAYTNIGVGGLVVDDDDRVLVVQEKHYAYKKMWKFPGGYAMKGEEFAETAIREVLEETGIECQFDSIITFRHAHEFAFKCSDLYIVCLLKPVNKTDLNIKKCNFEISDCKWIKVEELRPQLSKFNRFVIDKYLENRAKNIKIGSDKVESIISSFHTVYSIQS